MARKRKFDIPKLQLKVARSRAGLGLYTLEPIEKGTCVIEYIGKSVTEKQVEASNSRYLFEVTKTKTIDGAPRWNTARYINHSCRPNCEIEIWRQHIYVMARRAIKPGEELCYNYGKDYFDLFIRDHGCRCPKCKPPRGKAAAARLNYLER